MQDREFEPSSILVENDKEAQFLAYTAKEIAERLSDEGKDVYPKHVYGLALRYALGQSNMQFKDFANRVTEDD